MLRKMLNMSTILLLLLGVSVLSIKQITSTDYTSIVYFAVAIYLVSNTSVKYRISALFITFAIANVTYCLNFDLDALIHVYKREVGVVTVCCVVWYVLMLVIYVLYKIDPTFWYKVHYVHITDNVQGEFGGILFLLPDLFRFINDVG